MLDNSENKENNEEIESAQIESESKIGAEHTDENAAKAESMTVNAADNSADNVISADAADSDDTADPDGEVTAVSSAFEWLDSIVIALVGVILIFTLVLGKVEVSGRSMMDTLQDADQLIITAYNYTPKSGDIVILSPGCATTKEGKQYDDKPLVKRIIATQGQTVEIKDGEVYVDGEMLKEDYARTKTEARDFTGKRTVPEHCVFVLGDNRDESADGRNIGFVDENHILGKVLFRIYPFDSIGTID